jgi:hypothetical protein
LNITDRFVPQQFVVARRGHLSLSKRGECVRMRWLFIVVLGLLVACVLSIVVMNDGGRMAQGPLPAASPLQPAPGTEAPARQ